MLHVNLLFSLAFLMNECQAKYFKTPLQWDCCTWLSSPSSWPSCESPFHPRGNYQAGVASMQRSWVHVELLGDFRKSTPHFQSWNFRLVFCSIRSLCIRSCVVTMATSASFSRLANSFQSEKTQSSSNPNFSWTGLPDLAHYVPDGLV